MDATFFDFNLGNFTCKSISDGGHYYDLGALFNNVPVEQVEAALVQRGLPTDKVFTPYTCLYLDMGAKQVLVDLGGGKIMPHAGKMHANLAAAGVDPAEIDSVIITHAHPDHIGGTVDEDGKLVYANADYFIWGKEWDFWWSTDAEDTAPAKFVGLARDMLGRIKDRVSSVVPGDEIVEGITAVDAKGHTPGHLNLAIVSEGELLLHISDTVLYPLHLENPEWLPVFDMLPDLAAESKQRIFNRAADSKALVFAHHFPPFPNLGRVVKQDVGWEWKPVGTEA